MTKTHGLTTTKLGRKIYSAWHDIKSRCYNTNNKFYHQYGGEGIILQENWEENPVEFYNYVSKLDNCDFDRSIDRIDNDLGYCEGNLRWATSAQQVRNRGKNLNNTSGKCGVTWYCNKTGGTRAVAWWHDRGKVKTRSFSEKKFGLLIAFKMACEHREKMINHLNSQGAGYSDKHGK